MPIYREIAGLSAVDKRRRARYNTLLSSTRIVVEQSIGSLKMRFPLVLDSMRLSIKNIKRVFVAAIALHNFVLNTGGGYFEVNQIDEEVAGYNPDEDIGPDDEVV